MKSSGLTPRFFHLGHLHVLDPIPKEGPVTDPEALGSRQEGREREGALCRRGGDWPTGGQLTGRGCLLWKHPCRWSRLCGQNSGLAETALRCDMLLDKH